MNKIFITGNLGQEPTIKQVGNVNVASFSVGVTETYKKQDGTKESHTDWFECECWRGLADIAQNYLHKGSKVAINGKMRSQSVDKDGQKRTYWRITIEEMEMLTPKHNEPQNANKAANSDANTNDDDFPW